MGVKTPLTGSRDPLQVQYVPGAVGSTSDLLVRDLFPCMPSFDLAVLVHSNAQHHNTITGMTREQLEEGVRTRRLGDTKQTVIVVKTHKTGR